MRSMKKGNISPVQIFLFVTTKRKIIGLKNNKYYHKTCVDRGGFFKYPLIDHDETYNYKKKQFMVCYGYKNERSEEQLLQLNQELQNAGKQHHLRVVRTRCNDYTKQEMIKVILSMQELDDDTWKKLEASVFDVRYDTGPI